MRYLLFMISAFLLHQYEVKLRHVLHCYQSACTVYPRELGLPFLRHHEYVFNSSAIFGYTSHGYIQNLWLYSSWIYCTYCWLLLIISGYEKRRRYWPRQSYVHIHVGRTRRASISEINGRVNKGRKLFRPHFYLNKG